MEWWTSLSGSIERVIEQYGLLATFILILVEEAGVPSPIPADIVVLLAAIQARQGHISLWQLIVVAEIATVIGASALYFLARWAGRDLVQRYGRYVGLGAERLDRVESRVRRGGVWTVALGRILPGLRVVTAVACGVFEVPYRVFLPGMAIGALVYILVFAALGYVLGPSIILLLDLVHLPFSAIVSMGLLGLILVFLVRARRGLSNDAAARAGGFKQWGAGFVAGALAAVCAVLLFTIFVGVLGVIADLAPTVAIHDLVQRFVAQEKRLIPVVISTLILAVIGAGWGGIYGRWGEPVARGFVGSDVARGIVFAFFLWAGATASLLPTMEITTNEAIGIALVQVIQYIMYGGVLGLAYPLFCARLAAPLRKKAVSPTSA